MFVGCGCHTCVGWWRSWVIEEWDGSCFIVVLLWCVVLSLHCTVCLVATSPCWQHGPVSRCERRMEKGSKYLPEQSRQ